eukprot:CAMPEP_0174990420 /NCGR_PEP_ID=MMETSP0004_2-20121128/21309_1 /TAXON_ID=420556 /ORGANISM="Ochromonas sp., Strain CCMP1393" /LENGTH=112 /DNA_ID=CAMNT_0016244021 /DNA_START=368 /DNA_END=706 /DNA_ORIENTATION=+
MAMGGERPRDYTSGDVGGMAGTKYSPVVPEYPDTFRDNSHAGGRCAEEPTCSSGKPLGRARTWDESCGGVVGKAETGFSSVASADSHGDVRCEPGAVMASVAPIGGRGGGES